MHVPGLETTQHPTDPKSATTKTESSGVFASFLKDIQNQDVSLLRIAGSLAFTPELSDLTQSEPHTPVDDDGDAQDAVSTYSNSEDNNYDDDKAHADQNGDDDDQSVATDGSGRTNVENPTAVAAVDLALISPQTTPTTPSTVGVKEAAVVSNVTPNTPIASQSAAAKPDGADNVRNLTPIGNQAAAQAEASIKTQDANPLTKSQNAAGAPSATVTVTMEKATLHSRPASTLASSAAVAAQTVAPSQGASSQSAKASAIPTDPTATSGNLLLNAAANKGSAQNQSGQQHTGQQSGQPGAPTTPPVNPTAQPLPTAPAPTAATAATVAMQQASTGASTTSGQTASSSSFGDALTSATGPASGQPAVERPGQILSKPPAPPSTPPRPMTDQIAVQIRKAVDEGVDKIRIQLRPAELGRVEIKLDIGADGRVAASVSAERPETMELLQRDARGLQQALQDAGLRADSGSLSFNLSGQNDGENAPSSGNDTADGEAQPSDDADVADSAEPRRASDSLIDVEV
jgi:flagellar hook-length control protein FliK